MIINDGSSDDTEKLCRDFVRKYPGSFLSIEEKRGCSSARNLGLDSIDEEIDMSVFWTMMIAPGW